MISDMKFDIQATQFTYNCGLKTKHFAVNVARGSCRIFV